MNYDNQIITEYILGRNIYYLAPCGAIHSIGTRTLFSWMRTLIGLESWLLHSSSLGEHLHLLKSVFSYETAIRTCLPQAIVVRIK